MGHRNCEKDMKKPEFLKFFFTSVFTGKVNFTSAILDHWYQWEILEQKRLNFEEFQVRIYLNKVGELKSWGWMGYTHKWWGSWKMLFWGHYSLSLKCYSGWGRFLTMEDRRYHSCLQAGPEGIFRKFYTDQLHLDLWDSDRQTDSPANSFQIHKERTGRSLGVASVVHEEEFMLD